MEPFKLMDTPFLVFQKIIKLMEIIEVFEMSQTSKRMFGCIKYSKRRIQPIQLFKAEKRRTISVYEKTDENAKLVIWLKTENERNGVMRQLKMKDSVLDVCLTSQLLDMLKPTIGVTLKCRVEEGFNQRSIFNLKRIRVTNAKWVSFDDLLKMDCEKAFFKKHSFTQEDVKKFINLWMAGSNPKLMHLRLRGFKMTPNWEHILEGIEYELWDEKTKKRPKNFINRYIYSTEEIDCEKGLDFERKSDGMIGTIMHQSDQIDFFVWHETQF